MRDYQPPLSGCTRTFARHGSYPPRQGWLLKVHEAVQADPGLFSRADATVVLGVGSSMVPSMKFWSRAFGLLEDAPRPAGAGGEQRPTRRGHWLLAEDGADPYLELPSSLWLLHWWLLSGTCQVPTWFYLFGCAGLSRQTRLELRAAVRRAAVETGWAQPSEGLVSRDIAALVSMYAPTQRSRDQPRATLEDVLSNPFRDLGILQTTTEGALHRARRGEEALVVNRWAGRLAPRAVLAYACLSYAHRLAPEARAVSLARLATDPAGPGRLMLADAPALRSALEVARADLPDLGLELAETIGDTRLVYPRPADESADLILAAHYRREDGPDGRR
ncbi:DUF4007 family protein [Kitasatospora sp. NBC_00240]|uniref:DUF4007 family protein n=1 Tax=Kitasatospora sp. NBC_00240 TaxID=2903567 RepID=UPI00224D235B|nr:DUF4007 family protein [Kitasatospora sp. NBC_00240]MCX5215670.1 DUF4007 family protein [Kitasatospora sp. NBC_00240]